MSQVWKLIMPHILSPLIDVNSPGMWMEGAAYEKKSIYSIASEKNPPVNYDEHIIRSHSPLNDASESPVVPVLFTKEELFNGFYDAQ